MSQAAASATPPPSETLEPRRVIVRAPAPAAAVARMVSEHRLHPLVAATLWSRGVRIDVDAHLAPPLDRVDLPALDAAAERLEQAIARRERILVHGDYDADGVTATALLTLALRSLGADATPYLPDRLGDGYGVHPDRVEQHAERADLLVTVDCGIGNVEEVRALRAAGVDVIVTDHHEPGDVRPDALVVHPFDGRGCRALTGAGVAFHLVWALHDRLGLEPPLDYLDLAAVGTVADVAPLVGVNRSLVRAGLERIATTERPGLRALLGLAKLRPPITARHLGFVVGPRLNAAGRLGHADQALELLLTADDRRGRVLATLLEGLNDERRRVQDAMVAQALDLAALDDGPALVLEHPDWHPGVMGIVASQVVERVHKPVFVIAAGKGSVRTVPGVSAVDALAAVRRHLRRWGGHAMAAGFAIDADQVAPFRAAIRAHVAAIDVPPTASTVDALLHPGQVDDDLVDALDALEPYGEGHPEPRFAVSAALEQVGAMGAGRAHLQATMGGVRAVGWRLGHHAEAWRVGDVGVGVATLTRSTWRERTTIELRLDALSAPAAVGVERSRCDDALVRIGPAAVRRDDEQRVDALAPELADPLAPLSGHVRAGQRVLLDLGPGAAASLRRLAATFPSMADARRAFVLRSRGRAWPWSAPLATYLGAVLAELDLLDDRGRARVGRRVDPYAAPTLRASLVARYALETLATALETLTPDDAATVAERLAASDPAAPADGF